MADLVCEAFDLNIYFHSELRLSISGKDVPEDVKARLLKLHEENVALKEQLSTTQSKLTKAKNVISRPCLSLDIIKS